MELKDCNREVLNDEAFLKGALREAADECGATVLGESFHRFSPQGVSGVLVIAESHLFIHTWPEHGYVAADIFTCGSSVQPEKAAQILIRKLGAKSHSVVGVQRGILDA